MVLTAAIASVFLISSSQGYQPAIDNIAGMYPNGNGRLYGKSGYCFNNATTANTSCGGGSVLDTTRCSTGQATSYSDVNYICSPDNVTFNSTGGSDKSLFPMQTGSGNLCFSNALDCMSAPNSCSDSNPCVFDVTTCSTGMAAGYSTSNWFCPADRSSKSVPNGGGQLCFKDKLSCESDFNNMCNTGECIEDSATCATGAAAPVAGATPWNWFCTKVTPMDGIPNGAGSMCYTLLQSCIDGANACNSSIPCVPDYGLCSTGQAGPTPAWYNCPVDTPIGALPDGSGMLCYDTVSLCNNGPNPCSLDLPCVFDAPTCATGAAALGGNYRCSPTMPYNSLPTGAGKLCYKQSKACNNGPNACNISKPCEQRTDVCSTGQAALYPDYVYICSFDLDDRVLTNGGGQFCYNNVTFCNRAANACGSNNPCKSDTATCSTGTATPSNTTNYYCQFDTPKGAVPAGSGGFCYDNATNCHNGPNGCSIDKPCTYDAATCSTGQAAGLSSSNWFCQTDTPPGSVPNGAGEFCYDSSASCSDGPNSCSDTKPGAKKCAANAARCATGQASRSGKNFFCDDDMPSTSMPNAFGALCYTSQKDCAEGPNACMSTTKNVCGADKVTCGMGEAGPKPNWFFCPDDQPLGSVMNGGGILCYDTVLQCNYGPNPCSLNEPCVEDRTACSTGPAALRGNFVCQGSTPAGATYSRTGRLVYDTIPNCLKGPNACMVSADCVSGVGYFTGPAKNLKNGFVCSVDLPSGAYLNKPGGYCYDTLDNCAAGPNACNNTLPCAKSTTVCNDAAAAAGASYWCPADLPSGASLNAGQSFCYTSYESCVNGPNVCGFNLPCVNEGNGLCSTGDAQAAQAQWICTGQLSTPASQPSVTSSSFPAWKVSSLVMAVMAAMVHDF